jgi:hypothetical protein
MDVSTQKSFHQISKEEGQWMTYWQQHPHLPRWHAQTAIRHTRDEQLLHRVLDVWTGTPLKQRSDDHQSMEMPPEVWTTQPPTPSVDGASRHDHSLVVFRCLIHCNNSLFHDDEPQCLLPDRPEGLPSSTPPNKDDAEEADDCPPLEPVAVVETAKDSPTAAFPVSNCPKVSVLPAALFAALSQHFFYSGEAGASSSGCAGAANQQEKTAASTGVLPSAPAVMIRFQCQAASGMAGVWFRRVGDAATTTPSTGQGVDVCIDERITMALKTAGLCGSWRIAPSRVLSMLSDACHTCSTTTTVAPAGGVPLPSHDTAEVTAMRWLTPARVFSDALSLQGSVVQLMHRAPFLHPHGAVQEVFEIFGPCVVREWRGTRKSAPCFLITFTGERFANASDLALDDGGDRADAGNEEALSRSMTQKAHAAAALLRQRRMCAAEDASFALAQLQRFFAVDWGLTLTYQFGSSADHRRGAGGGGGGEGVGVGVGVQKNAVEVAIVATPAAVAAVSAVSAVSESAASPADNTLVPAPPPDEVKEPLHDITSSKPKKKRYVAPNSQTAAEEEQQHQRPQVYHIPTIMCPYDGNCSMINDPDHQQVYLHRCTLPPPCAFETNPLHGPYFLH